MTIRQPALADLVIEGGELDRELVATFLLPYLRIDRRTSTIIPLHAWSHCSNGDRILIYLVAVRAMYALALTDVPSASPARIERGTLIPGGSVRPALKRLLAEGLVVQHERWYRVPMQALYRVVQEVGDVRLRQYRCCPGGAGAADGASVVSALLPDRLSALG